MPKFTVRSVDVHDNVIAQCETLTDAICVKMVMINRYGFECAIFDADEYLVSAHEQREALDEVYERCRVRPLNPLAQYL